MTNQPLTAMLAEAIVSGSNRVPDVAQRAAVRLILLDYLGVTLAGLNEPVAAIVRAEFGGTTGAASIVGTDLRASVADAALVNGTTGHALDYDDVQEFIGHPGTVIVPAALAAGEAAGVDIERLTRAIVVGFDAARFVGTLAMPGHYSHGFHSTATVGAFGATAAVAVLLDLDLGQTATAIGLAGTQAAGLKSMFGTMAKPFHAGRAAAAGVTAARLAARGLTANTTVLEVSQGFLATQAHQPIPSDWTQPTYGESLNHLLFKYHAACYYTHSSIEALQQLMIETGLTPETVVEVILHVPAEHLKTCNIELPKTGLEIKFSLRHIAALVLSGIDTAALETFNNDFAINPALMDLRERVRVEGDHSGTFSARVVVKLADGREVEAIADVSERKMEHAELYRRLDSKFMSIVEPKFGHERAYNFKNAILYSPLSNTINDILFNYSK